MGRRFVGNLEELGSPFRHPKIEVPVKNLDTDLNPRITFLAYPPLILAKGRWSGN